MFWKADLFIKHLLQCVVIIALIIAKEYCFNRNFPEACFTFLVCEHFASEHENKLTKISVVTGFLCIETIMGGVYRGRR